MPLGTVPLVIIIIIPFPYRGNGILKLYGFVYTIIIPFPHKGNGILILCGFIFPIIIVVVAVNLFLAQFSRYLNETWWAHWSWA